MAEDLSQYYWMTKDNQRLRMVDMEERHIKAAHTHACQQEYKYFEKQNIFNSLREMLEKVAESRGIVLKYPDERFPSPKWGNYFCAMRQVKTVIPASMAISLSNKLEEDENKKEAVLASNLENVDVTK